jgi:dipeptidyl aminopeptidase/acylaminoacyl peptidase
VRDLTPGEKVRATFAGWAPDDRSFYIQTNRRDPKFMDLYEVSVATLEPALLYENTDGFNVGGVSPDRRYVTLVRRHTTQNNDIHLHDLTTKQTTLITRHEGDASFGPSGWSPDAAWFYYTSDEGGEFSVLKRREVASGKVELVDKAEWDVSGGNLSKRGTYLLVGVNADARTQLRLYKGPNRTPVTLPSVPAGDIAGLTFSPSEKLMAFYVNGDRSPSNLFVMDVASGKVRQLTNTLNPEIRPEHLVEGEVVRYASFDGTMIPALLWKPHAARSAGRVPVVLDIHGGPGGQSRFGYGALTQYLLNGGYAVMAVNNRGSSGYGKTFYGMDDRKHGEADLDDVVWAKRWLATQPWADTGKVVIMGGSYGGYMTLAGLAFRPKEFAAGVDIFGVSNWLRTLQSIPPYWEAQRKALYTELGDPAVDSARLHRISPLFHASNIERPLLVIQGENDPRVIKPESDEIVEAVRQKGGVVEYIVFPDEGHGFQKKENQVTAYRTIREFLDRHVKERPST